MFFHPDPKPPKRKKPRRKLSITLRVSVWRRDKYKCVMCGKPCPQQWHNGYRIAWGPHHIVHVSQGGPDRLGNLITLCDDCHVPCAHQYKWLDLQMPKREFMGACFTAISSDWLESDVLMAEFRVFRRQLKDAPWSLPGAGRFG